MYFWKIDLLKQQLSTHGLTEKQLYYYILIYVSVKSIMSELLGYSAADDCLEASVNSWSYAESIIGVTLEILGAIMAFRANGGASGVKFAERYISIGFVATIRFFPLLIAIAFLVSLIWPDIDNFYTTAAYSISFAMLYVYIAKHIRQVAVA